DYDSENMESLKHEEIYGEEEEQEPKETLLIYTMHKSSEERSVPSEDVREVEVDGEEEFRTT
ncbi:hypothetical protein KI387_022278, partial [Taxus chinensis]